MVTFKDLCQYLYLPSEDTQDKVMVENFIEIAKVYLKNAVNNFDALYEANEDFTKQADLFITIYASELYQNRNQFNKEQNPSYLTKSLVIQLQTYSEV